MECFPLEENKLNIITLATFYFATGYYCCLVLMFHSEYYSLSSLNHCSSLFGENRNNFKITCRFFYHENFPNASLQIRLFQLVGLVYSLYQSHLLTTLKHVVFNIFPMFLQELCSLKNQYILTLQLLCRHSRLKNENI